jgi:phosphohistidine swiveling domain-containing protein
VLGTAIATKLIREGDLVEVDGSKGEVRVLERAV